MRAASRRISANAVAVVAVVAAEAATDDGGTAVTIPTNLNTLFV